MNETLLNRVYNWYYSPGEVLRSIGFWINPYKKWDKSKFRHIFAFDDEYNLYVGQFSVYYHHLDTIFKLKKKKRREYGMIYPREQVYQVRYSDTPETSLQAKAPVIYIENMNNSNMKHLNFKLRLMSQRLYDYGMPKESFFVAKDFDLFQTTIELVGKDELMERPDREWLLKQLKV